MDVDVPSWAKLQEVEDASIVEGYVNESGHLVLKNKGGAEFNAGDFNLSYISAQVSGTDVLKNAATTASPLFRIATFGVGVGDPALPAEDSRFKYHADGITIKVPGVYRFHGILVHAGEANMQAWGLRISLGGGAGIPLNAEPVLKAPIANTGLVRGRVDVIFDEVVSVANRRYYFEPFVARSDTAAWSPNWYGALRISQVGTVVTPPA